MAHKGIPKFAAPCLLLYCTLYNCVHVLKLTCNLDPISACFGLLESGLYQAHMNCYNLGFKYFYLGGDISPLSLVTRVISSNQHTGGKKRNEKEPEYKAKIH